MFAVLQPVAFSHSSVLLFTMAMPAIRYSFQRENLVLSLCMILIRVSALRTFYSVAAVLRKICSQCEFESYKTKDEVRPGTLSPEIYPSTLKPTCPELSFSKRIP